jgi:hypothetical protein
MTDFLTSLTARSFAAETAIRPRVASLFEPVRNGDAVLREAAAEEPIETATAREVEGESHGERRMSGPAPALRENEAKDSKHSASANVVMAVVQPPRGDSERGRTTIREDERWEADNAVVAAKVRPRKPLLSPEEDSDESAPALRADSEGGPPKRVSARALIAYSTPDESFEKDQRGLVLPPKVTPELTAQMKSALAMNVGLSAPAREKAGIPLPPPAAEPSVHVTIGRIEVRATSESKQMGRPRPASPVMSLEEYLHRRAQRGQH